MFLNFLINIVFFLIIVIVVRNSFEVVPPIHFAVPVWFGKRLNILFYEGFKLKPPFSRLWVESLVPRTLKSGVSFFAKDNREVVVKTTTRWRPDPEIKSEQGGGPRCLEITEDFIDQGLKSKIESEIGRFGGVHDHSRFIGSRRAIEYFLDSILRLKVPPHVNPAKFLDNEEESHTEVGMEKRLDFYDEHSGIIGEILRKKASEQKSYTEEFYGVDILNFTVDDVTFSDKTRDALEARERAKDELRGMALLQDGRVAVIAELVDRGIDPEAALDAADALLKISEKKTISIPGLKNIRLFGGE